MAAGARRRERRGVVGVRGAHQGALVAARAGPSEAVGLGEQALEALGGIAAVRDLGWRHVLVEAAWDEAKQRAAAGSAACARFPLARTLLLEAEAPYARGEVAYQGALTRMFPAKAADCAQLVEVHDGYTARIGERSIEALAMPGHTAGSAAWLVDDLLFLGDSGRVSNTGELAGAPWFFSDNPDQNAAQLPLLARRLAGRTVHTVLNAHTGNMSGEAFLALGR